MKTISKLMVLLLLAGVSFAKPVASEGEPPAKAHHAKKKVEKKAVACEACEAIKQLKEQIQAQQAEIDQLKGVQPQAAAADQKAAAAAADAAAAQKQAADAAAAAADANAKAAAAQSDVSGLKTTVDTTAVAVQKDTKRVDELEEPASLHYKGVRLTPGGYAQLATIWRQRNANSDTADSYGGYPYQSSADYYLTEWRESGRASRLSLKVDGSALGMKFMEYTEIDFLHNGNGTEVQTNSFAPRLRLAFANVDLKGGWSIAGGQNWSLIQTTRKGIDPLTEWLPALIDNAYTPGFTYARQGSIRAVKQITPKAWFGISAENPDTVVAGGCSSGACSFGNQIVGLANTTYTESPSNGYLPATDSPSNNIAPDLVAKVAFEPGFGHFEVKYIARWFRDRVYPNYGSATAPAGYTAKANTAGATNKTTEGGAVGFGMVLPVVKNKIDLAFQGLGGLGIGRFSTTGGPDVTYRPDGSLEPVKAVMAVVGIETHPTPKFDFDIYGGGDYYQRLTYTLPTGSNFFGAPTTSATEIGYGSPNFRNDGCSIEGLGTVVASGEAGVCTGAIKTVWSIQPQIWYRLYKGKAGTVQFGASYAYVAKEAWAGRGPVANNTALPVITGLVTPKANNQIVMSSFRYYIP